MEKVKLDNIDLRTSEGRETYVSIFNKIDSYKNIARFTTKLESIKDGVATVQFQIIAKYKEITFSCLYKSLTDQELKEMIHNRNLIDLRSTYVKDLDLNTFNYEISLNAAFSFLDGYTYISNLVISDICLYQCTFGEGNKDFTNNKYLNNTIDYSNMKFASGMINFSNSDFGNGKLLISDFFVGSGDVIFNNCNFNNRLIDFRRFMLKKGDFSLRNCQHDGIIFDFSESYFGIGTKDFSNTNFKKCELVFTYATFCEGALNFENVDFGLGNTYFTFTDFSDSTVSFFNSSAANLKFYSNSFLNIVNMNFKKINTLELLHCNFEKTLSISTIEENIQRLSIKKTIFNRQLWIDSQNCIEAIPRYYKALYNTLNECENIETKEDVYPYYQLYFSKLRTLDNTSKQKVHNNIASDFETIISKYKIQGLYRELDKLHIAYSENFTKTSDYILKSPLFKVITKLSKHISRYGTDPTRAISFAIGNVLLFSIIYFFLNKNAITGSTDSIIASTLYLAFSIVICELFSKNITKKTISKALSFFANFSKRPKNKLLFFDVLFVIIVVFSIMLFILNGSDFISMFILSFKNAYSYSNINSFVITLPNNFELLLPIAEKAISLATSAFIITSFTRKFQK